MSAKNAQSQTAPKAAFKVDLDKVSLEQTLRDFEIANARVLDLTQRLIASERKRIELENELNQLRLGNRSESPAIAFALRVARGVARRLRR